MSGNLYKYHGIHKLSLKMKNVLCLSLRFLGISIFMVPTKHLLLEGIADWMAKQLNFWWNVQSDIPS